MTQRMCGTGGFPRKSGAGAGTCGRGAGGGAGGGGGDFSLLAMLRLPSEVSIVGEVSRMAR